MNVWPCPSAWKLWNHHLSSCFMFSCLPHTVSSQDHAKLRNHSQVVFRMVVNPSKNSCRSFHINLFIDFIRLFEIWQYLNMFLLSLKPSLSNVLMWLLNSCLKKLCKKFNSNNLIVYLKSFFFFKHRSLALKHVHPCHPRDWTQGVRHGDQRLYSLSHLTGPLCETLLGTRRAIDFELEGKQIQKQAINIEPESLFFWTKGSIRCTSKHLSLVQCYHHSFPSYLMR